MEDTIEKNITVTAIENKELNKKKYKIIK